MTQDDKDKITGQTRREYREAKQELAALQSKARKLGERMVEVGNVLIRDPEKLIFVHESHDPQFQSRLQIPVNSGELTEVQNLLKLTDSIRDAVLKVSRLRGEVTRLEGEDPEN